MYAFGFRNPWRFSFDRATGDMWIGDVGQDSWEEVDQLPPGQRPAGRTSAGATTRAPTVYNDGNGNPKPTGRVVFPRRPVTATSRLRPANCSVTGGYVYRGAAIPRSSGHYLYADYCSGRIWRSSSRGGRPTLTNMSSAR